VASCAVGPCGRAGCYLCDELPRRFPPVERCIVLVAGERCRFVRGHAQACEPSVRSAKVERPELKESRREMVDMSQPRAAGVALGQKKRHRVGPHR
jgi:hypothetical protein